MYTPVWFQTNQPQKQISGLIFRSLNAYGCFNFASLSFELNRVDERSATSNALLGNISLVYSGEFFGWNGDASTYSEDGYLIPMREDRQNHHHDEMVIGGQMVPVALVIDQRYMDQYEYQRAVKWAGEQGIKVIFRP